MDQGGNFKPVSQSVVSAIVRCVLAAGEAQDRAASERLQITSADLRRTRHWSDRNGKPFEGDA